MLAEFTNLVFSMRFSWNTFILLSFVIVLILLVQYHYGRRKLYYFASKVVSPPTLPIVGNAFYFSGTTEDILENVIKLFKTYDTPVSVWLGHRLFFGIARPKDLEIVLNKALEKDGLYKFAKDALGCGIFTAPVPKWKRNRKIILATLSQKILNDFVEVYVKNADILVEKLATMVGKCNFDVFDFVSRCSLDIICETATGANANCQTTDSNFMKSLNKVFEITYLRMFRLWFHWDFVFNMSSYAKELRENADNIKEFINKIILERKKQYKQRKLQAAESDRLLNYESPKRKAFLDYLIELSEEQSRLTDEELTNEVNTFIAAGSDTSSTMISFALVLLGVHPNIQDKVVEEISDVLDGSDRKICCEDLPKLKYLEMVIKETMRLFPAGPLIVRMITEDVQLDSCILPKGSSCVIPIICTHRDPKIWKNPLEFDPDRFLPEEVAKRHPYSYLPFSAGPRNCIGPKFAMMEMKTLIASILKKYRVKSDFKSVADIRVKADLVIKAADGFLISLENRYM